MSTISSSAWPGGCGTAILTEQQCIDHGIEPSGLTVYNDGTTEWFYLVSDNGRIVRRPTDLSSGWVAADYGSADYESVATVADALMLGIEMSDGNPSYPQIQLFKPSHDSIGKLTNWIWNLTIPDLGTSKNGMEAMTFVPKGSYPSDWGSSSPLFGGLFFAGFQPKPGTIYVYELRDVNDAPEVTAIGSFNTQTDLMLSDMYFTDGTLYVLFDDTTSAIEEMRLNSGGTAFETTYITTPPTTNCEAIAVIGSDLYLGYDNNGNGPDGVYCYANYTDHVSNPCTGGTP